MNDSEKNGEAGEAPVVFVYATATLHLKCPSCANEASVTLQKPLTRPARVTCNRCDTLFIVKPTGREQYRKGIDIYAEIDRQPIGDMKKRSTMEARITDMSRGGMGAIISKRCMRDGGFAVGDTVHMRFSLPRKNGEATIRIQAVIRNLIPQGQSGACKAGLEFTDLDEHAKKEIGFFLWN